MRDVTGSFAHLLGAAPRACRVCGCTEHDACLHPGGRPCAWVGADLCSVCAATIATIMQAVGCGGGAAERLLRDLIRIETERTGMAAPEFRRLVNGGARLH